MISEIFEFLHIKLISLGFYFLKTNDIRIFIA